MYLANTDACEWKIILFLFEKQQQQTDSAAAAESRVVASPQHWIAQQNTPHSTTQYSKQHTEHSTQHTELSTLQCTAQANIDFPTYSKQL